MELQIGKLGIEAAAKASAGFGIISVVAIDFFQFSRDHNFANLLGSLTVDVPSVLFASAVGAIAGTLAAGTLVVGTIALGPALVAFGVGVLVGVGLFALDKHFEVTKHVSAAYAWALNKLQRWWKELGPEAPKKWDAFTKSGVVQNMRNG